MVILIISPSTNPYLFAEIESHNEFCLDIGTMMTALLSNYFKELCLVIHLWSG